MYYDHSLAYRTRDFRQTAITLIELIFFLFVNAMALTMGNIFKIRSLTYNSHEDSLTNLSKSMMNDLDARKKIDIFYN